MMTLVKVPRMEPALSMVTVPRAVMRLVGRAVGDFDMIRPGDRILLGLSGGKDSLSLLHALRALGHRNKVRFSVGAATVDPCIEGFDPAFLSDYVPRLGIPYYYERQDIVGRAQTTMGNDSFCAYCSRMRRGALYAVARREGYNVLALGHHLDDLAETFLLNAFFGGRVGAMRAHYRTDTGDLRVIRPLVYVRERQLRDFAASAGLPAIMDNCPACFRMPSQRAQMKALLSAQESHNHRLFGSLLTAMKPLMRDTRLTGAPLHQVAAN